MKLPTRKQQKKSSAGLPKDFLDTVSGLFSKQFKAKLKGATFLVYGDLYSQEVILCISLNHPKSLTAASLHISSDLTEEVGEKPEKVTERLKSMVDVAASWFSEALDGGKGLESVLDKMEDIDPNWQELEWEGATLFVKLNKVNYALERVADDFLKKSGFEEEDELEAFVKELEEDDEDGDGERGPLQ
jgi:hypothetical protein